MSEAVEELAPFRELEVVREEDRATLVNGRDGFGAAEDETVSLGLPALDGHGLCPGT